MSITKKHLIAGLVVGTVLALPGAASAAPVTAERLLNANSDAESGNWLMVHRTYDSNRNSPLKQITPDNVKNLKVAFAVELGGNEKAGFGYGQMEGTPLVNNGFVYISDPWGTPYKFDVSSGKMGKLNWTGTTGVDKDPSRGVLLAHRGLALVDDLVVTGLNDGRVVAFKDETGDVAWDQKVGKNPGEGFTSAPLYADGKVVVGQSYGDWATRGFIAALDPKTGNELWRFYTIPEPGQPGSDTWKCPADNANCWKTGGAAAWVTGSYDPATKTIYWGTGNPVPMYDPEFRPGDNLYSNSSLALDADSGKLKWYFQYTPGDYHDYDEVGVQLLVDGKVGGESRKVLAHFGRNGIFYELDRTNGSFIAAQPYVDKLTWTKGIDPKTGKPIEYDSSKSLQTYAEGALRRGGATVTTCPNIQGGVNYFPTALDASTGVAYGAGIEGCEDIKVKEVKPADVKPGTIFVGGDTANNGAQHGSVFSYDIATGKQIAKTTTPYPMYAGVLLTPGLVWSGQLDGTFSAYDSKTLKEVWSFNTGGGFAAPPIAFAVNGKEYIAIAAGTSPSQFGYPELANKPPANVVWFFSL